MRILKEKGDAIFKEEMEELQEPFNDEAAPEPTSEDIPVDEAPAPPPEEEENVGVSPEDSFYPPNEDYEYGPDVHLTGNPNDGIVYPAGSKPENEAPVPEGELGIQEQKEKGSSMTKAEKVAEAKAKIEEAKEILKEELDLDMGIGDDYEIETPPGDEEFVDEGVIEEEPKSEEELVMDILADAEELYKKVVGEEEVVDEEMMGDEIPADVPVEEEEMLESAKAERIARLKERILAKKKGKLEESDDELLAEPPVASEDPELMDTLYSEKKEEGKPALKEKVREAIAKKIHESAESIEELFTVLDNSKYKSEASTNADIRREAFEEACEILGYTTKAREAKEAWEKINNSFNEEVEGVPGIEAPEADPFFEEAKKRSDERKAYLKKILNEEDTPIMAEQPEVEELMGLKILKKMGEDPKLVESKTDKFKENYETKKSFNFKELLNNGFLG